jgi:hypothetical protein
MKVCINRFYSFPTRYEQQYLFIPIENTWFMHFAFYDYDNFRPFFSKHKIVVDRGLSGFHSVGAVKCAWSINTSNSSNWSSKSRGLDFFESSQSAVSSSHVRLFATFRLLAAWVQIARAFFNGFKQTQQYFTNRFDKNMGTFIRLISCQDAIFATKGNG